MNGKLDIGRRRFFSRGAAALGLMTAGAAAALSGCGKRAPGKVASGEKPKLDGRFEYDVSAFAHTDPALLLYTETNPIATGFQDPKCLAVGPDDALFIGGDRAVKVFDRNGAPVRTIELTEPPCALAPAEDGRLFVACRDHLEVFDAAGRRLLVGGPLAPRAQLTGLALAGDVLYAADAANRAILRCDREGSVLDRFEGGAQGDEHPGFVIPSPYFQVLAGADGLLWANNPGRHRVEAYTLDGKFELGWGTPSMAPEGFCGCCNPVSFARLPDGRFVTSEKGLNRIKLHDPRGKFLGMVAGPGQLVRDMEQARKACANCRVGIVFPVACDRRGRVLALDPASKQVRIFTAKAQ